LKKCFNCGYEELPQNYFNVKVIQTESAHIENIDNVGREKFWEDIGRPND